MKRKDILFISAMVLVTVFVLLFQTSAKASENTNTVLYSHGRYTYDANGDGDFLDASDVVFDTRDLYYLYSLCEQEGANI